LLAVLAAALLTAGYLMEDFRTPLIWSGLAVAALSSSR
jgi:hypothetical protein